jgi:phage terminase large subunit
VEDGIEHLRSYEQFIIHPRCTLAASEARLWRYKTDKRTGDVLPELIDAHNHVWDAARYALSPLIRQGSKPMFGVA